MKRFIEECQHYTTVMNACVTIVQVYRYNVYIYIYITSNCTKHRNII